MTWTWLEILYALLVVDSLGAVTVAWFGRRWFLEYARVPAKFFPPAKGWAVLYFVLACLLLLTARGVIG
jgi:predicted small integral membrane protein